MVCHVPDVSYEPVACEDLRLHYAHLNTCTAFLAALILPLSPLIMDIAAAGMIATPDIAASAGDPWPHPHKIMGLSCCSFRQNALSNFFLD